jgi:hypothetical protein
MTVFPLDIRGSADKRDIRSLDEALSRGWITIREQDQAQVSAVRVRNESQRTVFLMAGEILGGGRQDRILLKDVLLTPGIGEIIVPVYCGEKDRWAGTRDSFDRAPHIAGKAMRGMAARGESQEAIWREIDQRLTQSGVQAPTRSYQSLHSDPDTGRRITDRVDRFRHVRTSRTVGLVIATYGRVVGIDLFGDSDLCATLWSKIVRSYVADYPNEDNWRMERAPAADGSPSAVRRFLDDLSRAEQSRENTPGAGVSFSLRGSVDGHVLEWNGDLVHAAAFALGDVRPLPGIDPRR